MVYMSVTLSYNSEVTCLSFWWGSSMLHIFNHGISKPCIAWFEPLLALIVKPSYVVYISSFSHQSTSSSTIKLFTWRASELTVVSTLLHVPRLWYDPKLPICYIIHRLPLNCSSRAWHAAVIMIMWRSFATGNRNCFAMIPYIFTCLSFGNKAMQTLIFTLIWNLGLRTITWSRLTVGILEKPCAMSSSTLKNLSEEKHLEGF